MGASSRGSFLRKSDLSRCINRDEEKKRVRVIDFDGEPNFLARSLSKSKIEECHKVFKNTSQTPHTGYGKQVDPFSITYQQKTSIIRLENKDDNFNMF